MARQTTWASAQILTASALNAEFDEIYSGNITRTAGIVRYNDDIRLDFGTSNDCRIEYDTGQTNDTLLIGVNVSEGGRILIVDVNDMATDLALAARVDPTVTIHSADATVAADYLELYHDQTDSIINTGNGSLRLRNAGTNKISIASGNVTFADNVILTGVADEIQLLVTGFSTQTTSLLVLEQSDGTDALTVSNAGNLYVKNRIGIANTSPVPTLHIGAGAPAAVLRSEDVGLYKDSGTSQILASLAIASTAGPSLEMFKTRGSHASPAAVVAGDDLGTLVWSGYNNADREAVAYILVQTESGQASTGADFPTRMDFFTTPDGSATATNKLRITGTGEVLVNGTTAYGRSGQRLEVNTSANLGGAAINTWSTTAAQAGLLDFNRSKSATIGTQTGIANGDLLGQITARGSDGTNFIDAAAIDFSVSATPGTNDMPGKIRFYTTADGASSLTERASINQAGLMLLGVTSSTSSGTGGTVNLQMGNATAGTNGELEIVGNRAADGAVGSVAFVNAGIGAAEKRMFLIAANRSGADNTAGVDFYTLQAGTLAIRMNLTNGLQMGAPTGGDKGLGTINCSADIYKNNTAYNNPDYVFDLWADGFAPTNPSYSGRKAFPELRAFLRTERHLPGISRDASGIFERSDMALEKVEEAYLYLLDLEERITNLEEKL